MGEFKSKNINKKIDMARFILDVMSKDILKVLEVLERDEFLSQNTTSIRCIDETNNNQFFDHDSFFMEDVGQVTTSPMMNAISKEQLKNDRDVLSKY